jgi:hypothetical protein
VLVEMKVMKQWLEKCKRKQNEPTNEDLEVKKISVAKK